MVFDPLRANASQENKQLVAGGRADDFLRGGGEMGALLRSKDWSQSELGPPDKWPNSLKAAVQIMLNSRYPMFVWWGPLLINFYNDAYRPFLGQRHPRALGIPAQDSWWDIWEQVGPQAEQVMKEGRATWNEEVLLVMERNGYPEETYFTWSYSPIQDDFGSTGGVFAACTEDTARVLGQRRMKTIRALASRTASARSAEQACQIATTTLSENSNDVPCGLIYLLDDNESQARLCATFGIERGHHPAAPEIVDLAAPLSVWPFRSVAESGEVEVIKFPTRENPVQGHPWPDPVQTAVVIPIFKPGQKLLAGFIVAGVSPLLRLDDDYRGFFGLLAAHVETSIANADAYQAERKRAEALAEIDRAKTRFFSNVSHEFRTPLTLMLGPLEDVLARHREAPSAAYEQLAVVHRNGLRLLRLVNTLLDFSRIEAGRADASYEPTDLSSFTAELASVFRSAMEKAGLQYRVECEPLAEPVYVDRDMWEKVVLNLLSNAFKFTFAGEVSVHLRRVEHAVEFSVQDTGTGIPEHELPRIFERFHRVEGAHGRTHEGTGIGLALVQELVKLHGGSVRAESISGKGSSFSVSIPLGREHLPAEMVERRTSGSVPQHPEIYVEEILSWLPAGSGGQDNAAERLPLAHSLAANCGPGEKTTAPLILLAEDNADMREYVRRLLSENYRVHSVANGEEALAAMTSLHPDLVLSDVMMPLLDGFGLVQAIRSDAALRNRPIILLSARAGAEARIEGLQAGADDYLVKPFTARELLARVGTHVTMARVRRQAVEVERHLREEAELERKRLRAALSASRAGTYRLDPRKGELIEYDPEFAELFGFPPDQIGLGVKDFVGRFHSDDVHLAYNAIEDCRIGKDLDLEFRVVWPDGSIHWIYDRGKMEWEEGSPKYLVGAITDITDRKLAQKALIQTEKLASVGRLAATVAHEINNPLEAITNLIYLARQETALSTATAKYLQMADEELARVAEITRQTLGFYRQSTGWASTQLGPILEQLLSVFTRRITNKRLNVKLKVKSDPEVLAVSSELRQLFANLLSNSIDAVDSGGKLRISVSRTIDRAGTPALRISIADSGPGIPTAVRGRIFEPFFTTKDDIGTGLGLWVCKNIAEKHGGCIRARSNDTPEKSWTVISVVLPLNHTEKAVECLETVQHA